MRTGPHHPTLALVLACTISILFFFLGITFPAAHFWGRYLLPIVLVFLWGRRRDIYVVAVLSVLLLIPEFWTESTSLTHFLASHMLPVAVLCGLAWLLAQQRQLQEQTVRHE